MASQPPPPPGQGRVPLPSASMARPQLTSWAPSPLDESEPLPTASQRPPTSTRPSPTSHLQSALAGGASQLPSYSQSGNSQTPSPFGKSNRSQNNTPTGYSQSGRPIQPSGSPLGQHTQSQRVPSNSQFQNIGESQSPRVTSSSHHQNVGQSQSQRIPSSSHHQNVGQSQSQMIPSSSHHQNVGQSQSQRLPSNSQHQNAGQGNIGTSISSSKFSNGQRFDPPGHTGMPTIPEMRSVQPSHSQSGSLSRISSRGPTPPGGVSVMAPKLDMTKRGDGKSHMPSQLDLTKSQIRLNAPPPNAPKNQPSLLQSNHDIRMASKHMNIASMSGREREEQLCWAKDQLLRSGSCKEGYHWVERDGGLQCRGGAHAATDELIVEGKGGVYHLIDKTWNWKKEKIKGPYYRNENDEWVRNTENDPPKKSED